MFLILIVLFFWILYAIWIIGTHLIWLQEWKKRPLSERQRYVKPEWRDVWEALKLGGLTIFAFAFAILFWILGI